ncbi:MAG TPA: MBL fold metallo-hydrolase [Vicinamibacterales bacterium]|nr:MBL fold metallo-hydrolase [Vicinamibacterales bacterium]
MKKLTFVTLRANNPGAYTGETGNNTYLLMGAEPALVDAGVGDAAHVAAIAEALQGAPLARVIVTHAHSDHASGAPAIAARWPGAVFLKLPWPGRDDRYSVEWQPLAEGDEVRAGDARLTVVHTPGHAPDHICLWHGETRSLFCGDLAVRGTTVVIPGGRGGSVSAYLRSLERVLALAPAVLLPSHGPQIRDVEPLLRSYIEHRLEREQQIVEALSRRARTIDDLLAQMYPFLDPQLHDAARASIAAHLEKLQDEGRVRESSDGTWELTSSPPSR